MQSDETVTSLIKNSNIPNDYINKWQSFSVLKILFSMDTHMLYHDIYNKPSFTMNELNNTTNASMNFLLQLGLNGDNMSHKTMTFNCQIAYI